MVVVILFSSYKQDSRFIFLLLKINQISLSYNEIYIYAKNIILRTVI